MSLIFKAAKVTVSGAPGTGPITLGPALSGQLSFSLAGIVNGQSVDYAIIDGDQFETGIGTYASAGAILTRTAVLQSSAPGNGAITASAAAIVYASVPTGLSAVATSGSYSDLTGLPVFGTGAFLNAGTGPGNLVELDVSTGKLPAVDGSQLTGITFGGRLLAKDIRTASASPITILGQTCRVMLLGAGGSVSSASNPSAAGAGAELWKILTGLTVGNTISLTIGAAAAGSNGGDTVLSGSGITTLTAGGGRGGTPSALGQVFNGGTPTNGDTDSHIGEGGFTAGAAGGGCCGGPGQVYGSKGGSTRYGNGAYSSPALGQSRVADGFGAGGAGLTSQGTNGFGTLEWFS